jgi:hypothetical protein
MQIHNHTYDPLAKQPFHYHASISTIVFYTKIVELTSMSSITSKVGKYSVNLKEFGTTKLHCSISQSKYG